ncbi:hypothetical protein SAMN06298216_4229 [Spirosomataceae bacterium TFI 002]|nr:hypothetical protein SAMN06298216_4229 [Spirosomataceae bacterium TFI 002]
MKKVLKVLGLIVLAIIVIGGGILLYISSQDIPSYEVQKIDYQLDSSPEAIKRGEKLALMLCVNCHLNTDTRQLTGKRMLDAPAEFGEIYSQNITQDKTYGIGDWTDGEILYLLRTGIKRNGQYSPPYMAKLPSMADEDINAIIAFLRSDNPMVASASVPDTAARPAILTKILSRVAFKPFPMPTKEISLPDSNQSLLLGKYLVHNLDCFSCHSADFTTNNFLNPEKSKGYMGGGNKPLDMKGRVKLTSNLTPDKETGIGNWSKDDFIQSVKYGLVKGDQALSYPMIPYTQLTDHEAGAIYDYLMTVPPIKNKIVRSVYN